MSGRYPTRLRNRGGNANVGNVDNDTATTTAASRRALGNLANRENQDAEATTKKSKPTDGIAERVRRGRSRSAKSKEEARTEDATDDNNQEAAAAVVPRRRSSSRRASAVAAAKIADDSKPKTKRKDEAAVVAAKKETTAAAKKKKEATTTKATSKKKAAPATKKEATKKNVGTKRSAAGEAKVTAADKKKRGRSQSRTTKRVKKSSSESTVVSEPESSATSKRTTRSRSRSVAAKKAAEKKKKAEAARREAVVEIVPGDKDHIVPVDFRLQRESFDDGHNFTYGIAHYDAADREDPLRCKDYVTDMFQHLYKAETEYRCTPYMDRQEDITARMRAILVDWLVEVHMKFRLAPETLYLCVHILDRYCSEESVTRSKLQLVGVTALFLATKHEEIYPPEVRDCVYITDRAYDRQEVLDMEQNILRVLNWKISMPTAYPFLDRFLSLTNASPMTRHCATYYLERTLQEHEFLEYRPSMVCASVVILALNNPDIRIHEEEYSRELPGLPKILMEYTQFDKGELMACMALAATKICEPAICASRRHLIAVKKKYDNRKYLSVSSVVEHPSIRYVKDNMTSDE